MCNLYRCLFIFITIVFNSSAYAIVPQKYLGKPLAKNLAVASLTKVIRSGRLSTLSLTKYYFDRGVQYANLGRHKDALRDYTQALKIESLSSKYYISRAISFARIEQYQEAFADLSLAEKIDPNKAMIYSVRGGLHFYLRRYKEAADDYKKYLVLKPTDIYRKLWLHLSQKHFKHNAKSTLELYKEDTKTMPWPGVIVELYRGEITAESVLRALKSKNRKSDAGLRCEAFFYLGQYYLLNNKTKQARQLFKNVVSTGVTQYLEYEYAKAYIYSSR
jgi:lipoprotein NlpI